MVPRWVRCRNKSEPAGYSVGGYFRSGTLSLARAAPGFVFGKLDLEGGVAGPAATWGVAGPILQDFQVVAAGGGAVAAAAGIRRVAQLQIAAANRIG
jgi:hypothetical protein